MLFSRLAIASGVNRLELLDINQHALSAVPADLQGLQCPAEVTVRLSDTACKEDAIALRGSSRVHGLIHAAGVLRDAIFLKQTASSFREVLAGKVCISHLPQLSNAILQKQYSMTKANRWLMKGLHTAFCCH